MSLRNKLIRLAHQKPELREHLLPLITEKTASRKNVYAELVIELVPPYLKAQKINVNSDQTWVYFKDTDNFGGMYALIQDHYLVFSAGKVGLDWETQMDKSSHIKLYLWKETKSSIGKKIEQYLSEVSKH